MSAVPEGYTTMVDRNGIDTVRIYELDDIGNAERFADQHRSHVRYVAEWRTWLVWNDQRWESDTGAVRVTAFAKDTARAVYADLDRLRIDLQAAAGNEGETKRLEGQVGALLKHAKRSASEPGLRAMLKLAESEPDIAIRPADLDADVHVLNTPTGIVDLRTGEVRPHDPRALCTRITRAPYDPHVECPFWLETLRAIFDGDTDTTRYLQRIVGLALHGNPGERIIAICFGPTGTGKTTAIDDAIRHELGEYAMGGDASAILLEKNRGGANEDIANLHGQRLVVLPELPPGKLNSARVKKLTGGDMISARRLFGHVFTFRPTHTFCAYTNDLPEVPETGNAIWDRLKVIPFVHPFTGDGKLKREEVRRQLAEEAAGILTWCVQGAVAYHRDGLGEEPESVRRATGQYRADEDVVAQLIAEATIRDADAWTSTADLYEAYTAWCVERKEKPEPKRWLSNQLVNHGIERKDGARKVRGFSGIRLEETIA
jgi:putative DNA primase/helicase